MLNDTFIHSVAYKKTVAFTGQGWSQKLIVNQLLSEKAEIDVYHFLQPNCSLFGPMLIDI